MRNSNIEIHKTTETNQIHFQEIITGLYPTEYLDTSLHKSDFTHEKHNRDHLRRRSHNKPIFQDNVQPEKSQPPVSNRIILNKKTRQRDSIGTTQDNQDISVDYNNQTLKSSLKIMYKNSPRVKLRQIFVIII